MLLYFLAFLFGLVAARGCPRSGPTTTFKWDVSYITAAPDGVPRPVIGVNGQFPPPTIKVQKNDVVELQITNLFTDGERISVHSHGLLENRTNFYDGVPQVTQWYQPPEQNLMKWNCARNELHLLYPCWRANWDVLDSFARHWTIPQWISCTIYYYRS